MNLTNVPNKLPENIDLEKEKALQDILESSDFKESKRYSELLCYLVAETLSGNIPKEITIGIKFFGKGNGFDPKEDPTVRVYINNLRKKLEHYYLTATLTAKYKISIPKGHYEVEFLPIEQVIDTISNPEVKYPNKKWIIALASLVIVFVITFIIYSVWDKKENPENVILSEFVSPGAKPTLIVLGDFYFLFERSNEKKGGHFVRDFRINTYDDYQQMIKTNPKFGEKYVPNDFTYLRPSASWGVAELVPYLKFSPNGYSIKLASQVTLDDLNSHNIIFIGSFKTLFLLKSFIHLYGLSIEMIDNKFTIQQNQKDSALTFTPKEMKGGNYQKDYALVIKGNGPDGNKVLLLLGFSDIGVLNAVKAVSESRSLAVIKNEFVKQNINPPYDFTLVLEAEGMSQAIFKSQIELLAPLKPKNLAKTN